MGQSIMLRSIGWILLMNAPAAMGATVWPEGTTGVFSLLNLLFTSVVVFMAGGGTMMYLYRRSKGLPPKPTRGKILQGNLRAALWLEYMAWSGSGVETHHTLQEGAALRVRDLENQLFEDPNTWASTSSSSISSTSSCSSSSVSSIDETLHVKSNTSERPHVPQPQNSTADGAGSVTIKKNNGKLAIHNSISSAHSPGPSRISAADKTRRSARHVLATPPKAHRPTSSNENKSPRLPLSHSHMFPPSAEDYPTRSARTRSNLRTSSNSYARSNLRTSSNSYASSNIYPSLALD